MSFDKMTADTSGYRIQIHLKGCYIYTYSLFLEPPKSVFPLTLTQGERLKAYTNILKQQEQGDILDSVTF